MYSISPILARPHFGTACFWHCPILAELDFGNQMPILERHLMLSNPRYRALLPLLHTTLYGEVVRKHDCDKISVTLI